jgi:hypothetical protein
MTLGERLISSMLRLNEYPGLMVSVARDCELVDIGDTTGSTRR